MTRLLVAMALTAGVAIGCERVVDLSPPLRDAVQSGPDAESESDAFVSSDAFVLPDVNGADLASDAGVLSDSNVGGSDAH